MLKKILLADDSLTIQKVVELTFTEEDYEVVVVGDGAQAIQRVGQDAPDIVLADVLMPKKSGYEVCEFVKSNPATRSVPVLLLVGKFEPFDEDRARKAGADGHILKPFESSVLVKRVTQLLAGAARSAPARGVSGTDVTAHGEAATEAAPFEAAPAAAPVWSPAPLAATVPGSPIGSDTAELSRESGAAAESFGADPFGGDSEAPAAFDDSPKSLLDADDEEPMVPSAYAEAAPFGEEPPPALEGSSSPPDASLGLAEPLPESGVASFAPAPAWEEPAPSPAPLPVAPPQPVAAAATAPERAPVAAPDAWSARSADASFEPAAGAGDAIAIGDFPEDVLRAIVERVVRRMSEDVVRDIAWQVVPELAELMIKKKLEELG